MGIRKLWPALSILCLVSCGGGGGNGGTGTPTPPLPTPSPPSPPPPPAGTTGQLKFANASGLAYSTPSRSGVTDARGTFAYAAGETVEFRIGNVVIGSALGRDNLTLVDLVPGGTADTEAVQNIARFLMMLDENADPADGIAVSSAVRAAAANWTQVDFAAADLDNELVTIISDVASVDGRAAALPDAAPARTKLVDDVYCALSGFFFGRMTGGRNDGLILIMNSFTGQVTAHFDNAGTNFESVDQVSVDSVRSFVAPAVSGSGDSFEGQFDTYDDVSGTWSFSGLSGEFNVSRRLPDSTATFRFTGRFYRQRVGTLLTGPLIINVDSQGSLLLDSHDLEFGRDFQASGTYLNDEFNYDYGDGQAQTGTTDASLYVEGRGAQGNGVPRPWFAQGCRLN